MVGRTPEFLGKKIEAREVKLIVFGTHRRAADRALHRRRSRSPPTTGSESIYDSGPQGFCETLYAYVSQANNNGSAFAGYTGYLQPDGTTSAPRPSPSRSILGGLAMLGGRFLPILVVLAVAGSLAGKRVAPPAPGRCAPTRRRSSSCSIAVDPARRPAHVRPRPPARARSSRASPTSSSDMRELFDRRPRRPRPHRAPRARLSARHDRRQPGRFSRTADGSTASGRTAVGSR